tara:strand:- start:8394 stop:11132 length:2739 start_codon:yes stop_codon:yes gene_type:complete
MHNFSPQNLSARLKAAGKSFSNSVDAASPQALASGKKFLQSNNISVDGVLDSVSGSVQDLKGATVNLTNSLNGLTGPGIGQSLVGSIANNVSNNLIDQIKGGIGGFLGAAFGDGFGTSSAGGGASKLPNPLEQFASFNYVFTLGCLTQRELEFPDLTYRRQEPENVILRSGGGPTRGSSTVYESTGKTEYFIENVDIETIVAGNAGSRSTNATSLSFEILEPYSMGLFLQALQVSALRSGYPNYIEAPYLLSVEFKGYDDAGNYIHASNLRRLFPIKLVNIEFDVTESGSTYAVQAIPYHEIALTDEIQTTHTDVSFAGSTVSEMLQTGAKSLTRIINDRELASEKAKKVSKANQYIIMFPDTSSSAQESAQFMMGQPEQSNDSATTREFTDDEIKNYYESSTGVADGKIPADYKNEIANSPGISVKRSTIGENIREYAEKLENMNEIGRAKIVKSKNDGGTRPMGTATNTESETTKGEIDRCKVQLSGDVRQATFSSGKKIQTIIEEIIISSEYGRDIANRKPDGNGMVPWFRIETQVFNADSSSAVVAKTGIPARVFVYRVVPYLVHLSKFKGASDSSPGIPQLKQQAIKEYNYIYTGKNKDIINFDIKFNHAFFTSINGDLGQAGLDSKNSVVQETTSSGERPSPSVTEGSSNPAEIGRTQSATAKPNTVDGGIGQLHPESQIARSFNEALMNSTVDLVSVDLEILGDPYYIADSGMGNYNALQVPGILNINSDGTMNYQNGEVDIELNFRTPLDYGPTGYMDFPANGTAPVAEFSGLYQVLFVNNKFSNGQFTQTLQTIRRQSQDQSSSIPAQSLVLNTDTNANQFTGTNANPLVGSADDYGFGVTGTRNNQTSSNPPAVYDDAILRQQRAASRPNPAARSTYDDAPLRALRAKQAANISVQQQSGPF